MTVVVSRPRRSARNKQIETQYKDASESEESGSEYEEEFVTNKKRTQKQGNKSNKKARKNRPMSKKTLEQLEADIEENSLYKALALPDVDIKNLALEWIEDFVEEKHKGEVTALTSLINLVLRSCGCLHLFQPHDLVNLDSASQTIGELIIAFTNQKSHKFPFRSLPEFRKNILEFFEEVIQVAHEKDELYKYNDHINDDQSDESSLSSFLMTHLLTWISSLSSCTIRPLRYTSTILSLVILNKLCDIVKQSISSLDKAQRQLTNARRSARNKSRIEILNKTINNCHSQKNTIIEYFNDFTNITLGHRYRDIDASIRQECVKHLCQSMIKYPDYFFQANFLRYFGWLLSDPSNHVRCEVSKVLLRLYRNASNNDSTMGIGFRQFTERYKKQLMKMCSIDTDHNVRLNCLAVCCELLKIGFMDEHDIKDIISIYPDLDNQRNSLSNATNGKLKLEIAKFVNIVNHDNVKSDLEKYSIFIRDYDLPQFGSDDGKLSLEECLKYKNLISILEKSLMTSDLLQDHERSGSIFSIFFTLCQLPYYANSWEFLVRYLLCDTSSIEVNSKDSGFNQKSDEIDNFKSLLDISKGEDKLFFICFICASVTSVFDSKGKSTRDEQVASIMVKLVEYLPSLQKVSLKSSKMVPVFVNLWYRLVSSNHENMNILSSFKNLGQTDTYVEITNNLIDYFEEYNWSDLSHDLIMEEYEKLFGRLFSNYNTAIISSTDLNIINSEIRLRVHALIQNLVSKSRQIILHDHSFLSKNDLDEVDFNSEDNNLGDQLNLVETLNLSVHPLFKLQKIADHININEELSERAPSLSLIEILHFKVLDKLDLSILIKKWPKNLQKRSDQLIECFKAILDLLLVYNSWKLEELIFVPDSENNSSQHLHDIPSLFEDTNISVNLLIKFLKSLDSNINEVFERYGSSITSSSDDNVSLLTNLMDLETLFSSKFIDLIASIKIFYIKFKGKNSFKDFDNFFDKLDGVSLMVRDEIPSEVQEILLSIFLYRETRLAKLLGVELERGDEEKVNFEDWDENSIKIADEEETSKASMFDSDNENDNPSASLKDTAKRSSTQRQTKENVIWSAEKDLCVYTVKLLGLIDTSLVGGYVSNRMRLNKDKLGKLFCKLVEEKNNESADQKNVASDDEPNTTSI